MDQAALYCLLLLIPLWIVSLFLFSRAAWHKLARNYQASDVFYGNEYGRFNARINDLNYAGRLFLKYNEEGIYLYVVKRYRPFHPPVLIPWNELMHIDKNDGKVLIEFGSGSETNLVEINDKTYSKLEKTLIQYRDQVHANLN